MQKTGKAQRLLGFEGVLETRVWIFLFLVMGPLSFFLRLWGWSSPLMEPHPIRQTQTALTVIQLFKGMGNVFDFRSPFDGKIWNNVYEFPAYQWVSAQWMNLSLSLEVATRLVTFLSVVGCGGLIVWFVNRNLGKRTASWAALFWLVSPFVVLYSRVCLVDFFEEFLVLLFLFSHYEFLFGTKKRSTFFLVIGMLSGALAAAVKGNIWVISGAIVGILCLVRLCQSRKLSNEINFVVASLVLQALCGLAWSMWSAKVRSTTGVGFPFEWIIGTFSERFNFWQWKKIFLWIIRCVLHDWMTIPFIAAFLFCPKNKRLWLVAMVFLILCSILLTFHVHTYHDYYLIGEVPFIIVIAAMGMTALFDLPKKTGLIFLLLTGFLFLSSFSKLKYQYGTLFEDYQTQVKEPHQLKALTSPEDIIFLDLKVGRYQYAVYSERLAGTEEYEPFLSQVPPSVLMLVQEPKRMALLKPFSKIWIQNDQSFFVYRVKEVESFRSDPKLYISVEQKSVAKVDERWNGNGTLSVDACQDVKGFRVVEIKGQGTIQIKDKTTGATYLLPAYSFLHLPSKGLSGSCQYELSLI